MNAFNLIIIGDEILHGSRQDKHFAFFKSLLESRGLKQGFEKGEMLVLANPCWNRAG